MERIVTKLKKDLTNSNSAKKESIKDENMANEKYNEIIQLIERHK